MGAVGGRGSHTFLHWIESVSWSNFLELYLFIFFVNYDISTENLLIYHRFASDYENIIAAAADFTSGRVWPVTFASESGPKFIWEKVN